MSRTMSSTARVALGSRLAVGSSRNSTSGRSAHARASASRCCSPPESTRAGRAASARRSDVARARRRCGHPPRRRRRRRASARSGCWPPPNVAAVPRAGTPSPGRAAARVAPPHVIVPADGTTRPCSTRSSVLLPEPFGPRIERAARHARCVRSTPSRMRVASRTTVIACADDREVRIAACASAIADTRPVATCTAPPR